MEPSPPGRREGDEFALPGCADALVACLFLGVPSAYLFLMMALGTAYGARDSWVWIVAGSVLLIAAPLVVARGVTTGSLSLHAVAYAAAVAAFVVIGDVAT